MGTNNLEDCQLRDKQNLINSEFNMKSTNYAVTFSAKTIKRLYSLDNFSWMGKLDG